MDKRATHDEALRCIGVLSHHAALADLFQFQVFQHLSGCRTEVARAIYFALESTSGRANLVQRVAEAVGGVDASLLKVLSEAIQATTRPRNQIAHACLFEHPEDGLQVFNPKHSKSDPLTKDSIAHRIRHSSEALQRSREAYEKICAALGQPVEMNM